MYKRRSWRGADAHPHRLPPRQHLPLAQPSTMALWTSLVLLSALAVSALSLPRPDESAYKIPQVGTGRRSQYYVLHDDGTYKYGYDTGEGAFESTRLKSAGKQDGEFGYRDPEGNSIHLQYEAGEGGFRPRGAHLPASHPDFDAAHAAARGRPPFVDPLADANTDASYGFRFSEDGLARTEQSDSDGTVRGSYSYVDEEGRTRSYSYTAGRGIGFVVEGDDLPQSPAAPGATPAATRLSSSAGRLPSPSLRRAGAPSSGTSSVSTQAYAGSTSFSAGTISAGAGASRTPSRFAPVRPAFTPALTQYSSPAARPSPSTYQQTRPSRPSPSTYQQTRPFESANTHSQLSPDGSYSFAYDTSSHSRAESGDKANNVAGKFDFVAKDDGQRRAINYQAGSATGFTAEGAHIPVGPPVPGSSTGQPTGRIVPVQEVPFIDPLADSKSDASYNFAFDSEQYSRSESADADGNVQGTYTVVDDDGTRRTYRFRAGEGIGFETEEVSTSRGSRPSSSSFATATTGTRSSALTAQDASARGVQVYSSPSARRPASVPSTYSSSSIGTFSASRSPLRSTFTPTSTREVFPGFKLRQYDASDNAEKFGYVLTFDN
nr:uncharacterized protein LOC128685012 [Cherax quadricarinatus]